MKPLAAPKKTTQKQGIRLRTAKPWNSLSPADVSDKRKREKLERLLPVPSKLRPFIAKRMVRPFTKHDRGFRLPKESIGSVKRGSGRLLYIHDRFMSMSAAEIAQRQRQQKQIEENHPQFKHLNSWEKRKLHGLLQFQIEAIGRERGRFQEKHKLIDDRIDSESLRRMGLHPDYPSVYSRNGYLEELRDVLRKPGQHAVGVVDVDNLNKISTEIDHDLAAALVVTLSKSLSDVLKPRKGFACVFGGDELYVYLPRTLKDAELIMDVRFRDAFAKNLKHYPALERLVKRARVDFTGVVQDFSSTEPRLGYMPNKLISGLSRQLNQLKKRKKLKGIVMSLSKKGRKVNV
jgi:GGDEF domain-containing protein